VAPDGTVFVGSSDNLVYAIDHSGTVKWYYATNDAVLSSLAVSSDGRVYVGSDDGNLYALGPDGSLIWYYATDYKIESSPTIGPNGTVYFVGFDNYLYALKGTSPLASSDWPKFRHDLKNNGRFGGGK
jgi:outer membrane protein assembly factor BamB